ncbi:MAG: MotA/TolQ/ExbB proton channel family protein [Planctomycetota bacterium]|nr:MotA/TolQ/ExbB proton channel family protein [Planctomycetota bacterium]
MRLAGNSLAVFWLAATAAAAERSLTTTTSFLETLRHGWQINLILGCLAFLGIFLVFHVLFVTRERLTVPASLLRQIMDDIASRDCDAALKRAEADPSLLASVLASALRLHNQPLERIHQALEASGRRAMGGLRQEVTYLANIGVIAPMLGLLGTVLGLMDTFIVLAAQESEGAKALMLGESIGKAIVTTVVGLFVAIPAMAAYYLLISRVNRIADEMEIAVEEVAQALAEMKG